MAAQSSLLLKIGSKAIDFNLVEPLSDQFRSLQDIVKKPAIDWKNYQEGVFSSKTIAQNARLSE